MEVIDSPMHGYRCYFYFATINAFTALQMCDLGSKPTSPSLEEARFLKVPIPPKFAKEHFSWSGELRKNSR